MNSFLNKNMLNNIENKIVKLHALFREKYNVDETSLRNIKTGDILKNRILYLNFPWESYEKITATEQQIVVINDDQVICSKLNANKDAKYIGYKYKGHYVFLYYKFDNAINNLYNYIRYRLPSDYGIVSNIDSTNPFYQCVKVKIDKYKLLEYTRKTWVKNEIPYLQYIDNIEEGINNVAEILYKPLGYEYKEWTRTGRYNISSSDYGLAQKPISERDFNRWNKNIELLESLFDSFFNIWNVVSYVNWNEENEFEWEV